MICCVLFDLDGTLIDTWHLYIESYRRTLEPYLGRPLSEPDIVALQPSSERHLFQRLVDEVHLTTYLEKFLAHYRSLHDALFEGPYPGVVEMLEGLREGNYLLGIVTGKSRGAWHITSARSDLGSFDVVVTEDDIRNPKPSPEGLLTALEALKISPSQALYVGDSLLDLEAARRAHVAFGAALWAKGPKEREGFVTAVRKEGAKACFTHPAAVVESLRSWKDKAVTGDPNGE